MTFVQIFVQIIAVTSGIIFLAILIGALCAIISWFVITHMKTLIRYGDFLDDQHEYYQLRLRRRDGYFICPVIHLGSGREKREGSHRV